MKNEKSVISNVVKNDLCLSCGLCVSICPYHVLEMAPSGHRLMPFYKNHDCANCGKCLETCPSWSINIKDMLSARDMNPQTPAPRGNEIDSYIYQTKSPDILKKSSSGGAVTQIIKLALESKLFEKAFTFKSMSLSGANFLEETALSELSESQGSKYILPSLQKLIAYLDTTKNPNAIIVSTPCNLHGILKYCKIKNIKTNNLLFVGLFCDMAMSENAISYFTNKYSGRKNIVAFDFRSKDEKGWPGTPKITYEDNSASFPPRYERIRLKPFCRIRRCLYCIDKLNMFADISCGDCYIGGLTDQLGNSNIIVRTPKGKELLAKISLDRSGTLNKVPIEQILDSQKLYSKMENYSNSLILSKKLKHNIYDDFPRLAYVKNSRNKKSIRTKNRYISFGKRFADKYMIIDLYYKIYTHMKRAVNRIRKEKPKSQKKHIMILGGGFDNKGAESMIRTAVYLARKKFPDHEPVVIHSPFNSSVIPDIDFKTLCVNEKISLLPKHPLLTILSFIAEKRPFKSKKDKVFDNTLSQTDLMVDISGLMLSSLTPVSATLRYLARIERARRLHIPYIIFPQSIGPFDYPRFWKPLLLRLIKKSLSYVSKVYVRENSSLKILKKMNLSNIELSMDSVFYYPSGAKNKAGINIEIPKMSIALIPNTKLFTYIDKSALLKLYDDLINSCITSGYNIYVLYHSSKDKELCKEICQNNSSVKMIDRELDSEQLETILSGFSFIISSRYHSIVNSYKEKVPAVIIGWADKYGDLAHYFSQSEYHLDIRKPFNKSGYLYILNKMVRNSHKESKKILDKITQLGERNLFQ